MSRAELRPGHGPEGHELVDCRVLDTDPADGGPLTMRILTRNGREMLVAVEGEARRHLTLALDREGLADGIRARDGLRADLDLKLDVERSDLTEHYVLERVRLRFRDRTLAAFRSG